jgi:hypothetical protein
MRSLRGAIGVALAFVFSVPLAGAIDEREFACEEAYAHLEDCCPNKPTFHCGNTCEEIDLQLAAADCLRRTSCDELRDSGACDAPTEAVCK